jgi:hypothetical protein
MTEYKDDQALTAIVNEALASNQFPDAEGLRVKAVYAKGSAPSHRREAAACKKEPKLEREFGDYDFFLIFWTNDWNSATIERKWEMVCHECYHITRGKEGEPKLRLHGGDFCELPEHDKKSKALAKSIPIPAIMKTLTHQVTFD